MLACSSCPTAALGTNDCRGWIRRIHCSSGCKKNTTRNSWLTRLNGFAASGMETFATKTYWTSKKGYRSSKSGTGNGREGLPDGRFYQFRMAFAGTQAKGSFKIMEDDVADALEADFVLPESAVKPGLKIPAVMYSIFGPGRRFAGNVELVSAKSPASSSLSPVTRL